MRLMLLNGSPRGPRSNTRLLLDQLVEGFLTREGHEIVVHYLSKTKRWPTIMAGLGEADAVVFAMPLYVHAMPTLVKAFIEQMPQFDASRAVKLGFIVQSGFPEPCQSDWLCRYFERLPERLGAQPMGIAVRGGVEGIKIMPPFLTRRTYDVFRRLGTDLAEQGAFSPQLIAEIAGPRRLSATGRLGFRFINAIGLGPDGYFGRQAKAHGVYRDRKARPYA